MIVGRAPRHGAWHRHAAAVSRFRGGFVGLALATPNAGSRHLSATNTARRLAASSVVDAGFISPNVTTSIRAGSIPRRSR